MVTSTPPHNLGEVIDAVKATILNHKITTEELMQYIQGPDFPTGGIVQGMSGSPILQDGRIIGAVTHVYLSDATQGYGMYIEWMLEKSDALDAEAQAA